MATDIKVRSNGQDISDNEYHKALEELYQTTRSAKSAHLKALRGSKATTATNKLEGYASALRIIVEAGHTRLKFKTAISVLDHVKETLPTSDDELCEPLQAEYLKTFRILLDRPALVEHLKPEQWQDCLDFTVNVISISLGGELPNNSFASNRDVSISRSGNPLSARVSQSNASRGALAKSHKALDDLLAILRSLSAIPNAPVISRAAVILETVIECLASSTRSQEIALAAFNNVARVLLGDNVRLLREGFLSLTPILRRLWTAKSTAIRDQLLGVLCSCQCLWLAKPASPLSIGHDTKIQLLEILQGDYQSRSSREILQMDDITLDLVTDQSGQLLPRLAPRQDSSQGLAHWLTLKFIAQLHHGVCISQEHKETGDVVDYNPQKRRKATEPLTEVLRQALKRTGLVQVTALQISMFISSDDFSGQFFDSGMDLLQNLTALLANEDSPATPWAMLVLSKLTNIKLSSNSGLDTEWKQVWEAACRATATASLARPASLLISGIISQGLLTQLMTSTFLNSSLFSGGKNGPAALSDAVFIMFITVLQSGVLDRDESIERLSMNVISWLGIYWTLPTTLDRAHNAQMAAHAQPEFLCSLLAALKGTETFLITTPRHQTVSILCLLEASSIELQELAITMAGISPSWNQRMERSIRLKPSNIGGKTRSRLSSAVFDLLQSKLRDFQDSWAVHNSSGRPSGVNADILCIASSLCVASFVSSSRSSSDSTPSTATQELSSQLWDSITDFVSLKTPETNSRLALVASKVLRIRDSPQAEDFFLARQLLPCTETLRKLIKTVAEASDHEDNEDVDMFDTIESRTSQGSQRPGANSPADVLRIELADTEVFTDSLAACLLDLTTEYAKARSTSHLSAQASSEFIKEVEAMESFAILNARNSIYNFLGGNPTLARSDILGLVEVLIESCLGDKEFDRSEAGLCLCARALTRLARYWTTDEPADGEAEDVLWNKCNDIYDHYIDGLLAKANLSSKLLFAIAELLDAIATYNPSYGIKNYPSIRTSLLKVLREATCLVQLRLSSTISRLFDRYILSEHAAIFKDVVDALPKDNENLEGISARFCILANLGSKWHTVLRQATYYLFETAAEVPSLAMLGTDVVATMSEAIGLSSGKELFMLFSSQILYTWFGIGGVSHIPFAAFGYKSLKELCSENEDEIVAQAALRSSQDHAQELSRCVSEPWETLLARNFAASEAYCLASQISIPEKDQLSPNSEASLRRELTMPTYVRLIESELPSIIATLFRALQDDRSIEKAFEKAELTETLEVFRQMSSTVSTTTTSFFVQQPLFRSRFLIEEIHWLCSRLELDFSALWTPAMLTFLYRSLLQSAHPAMGPLHASMVLRKIRIVAALGGQNSLQGYPLEMLLHNLRPYLTVFQCSEDAISIYQYLLQGSRGYLQSRLSYLAGVGVSVFAALTAFVSSSQDSTTQESHFQSTMSKAQEFRSWLGSFLTNLQVGEQDNINYKTLCTLVEHAQLMTGSGTSSQSSHQGAVLLQLLEDQVSAFPLLQPVDFYLSVSILCKQFSAATVTSDEILASPDDAARMIPVLKDVLRHADISSEFRRWAAHMIGKGVSLRGPFATVPSGHEVDPLLQEGNSLTESASYRSIVKLWENLLWKQDGAIAGSAEQSLQIVASCLDSKQLVTLLGSEQSQRLLSDLRFDAVSCPKMKSARIVGHLNASLESWNPAAIHNTWAADLLVALCYHLREDPILATLRDFAQHEPAAARNLLPYVVHLVLAAELDGSTKIREKLSDILGRMLTDHAEARQEDVHLVLDTIVYLRRCSIPNEANISQRTHWLEINYEDAARAAARCQLWHTALQLIELQQAHLHLQSSRTSRRSTQSSENTLPDFLDTIYHNVDDPDFFYAGHEDVDIGSIVQKLNHEGAGSKMLSFQSAMFDALGRSNGQARSFDEATRATVHALSSANLKGLSQVVSAFSTAHTHGAGMSVAGDAGFGLLDWNVVPRETDDKDDPPALARLKTLAGGGDKYAMISSVEDGLVAVVNRLTRYRRRHNDIEADLINLALLSEAKDTLCCSGKDDLDAYFASLRSIEQWGVKEDFDAVSQFLSTREYLFGTIHRNHHLRAAIGLTSPQAVLFEARSVRSSLQLAQQHESSQFALSRATYFSGLSQVAEPLGVNIEVAAQYDLARTLWSQQETEASVKILRSLSKHPSLGKQDIPITLSEILADLGQKVTEARLEPPNEVIDNYLMPAYKELGSDLTSTKAGQIFHTFAAFCDNQLQDQDGLEEFERLRSIKESKEAEMAELKSLIDNRETRNRDHVKNAYEKARVWYKLDNEEWERVRRNRESLVLRCLEHYLLSLRACDNFPNDRLRLLTIWLDSADDPQTSEIVNKHLKTVPSWKFAGLVNQLISRLLDTIDGFQQCLMDLMFRICSDHPYHSLYQLFAASKSKNNKNDETAVSRHAAANKLASLVLNKSRTREVWPAIHNLNIAFVRVAQGRLPEKEVRSGAKFPWRSVPSGPELIKEVEERPKKVPPPTMKVAIRVDRKYSSVPHMVRFEPQVSIAGGVSAPKIATVVASDGSRHKMLLKGGNDDLRQDSIMEQVFEQVSDLLQDHRATRQRRLGIRTYKVVPLLANAGIIEFVANTTPLHEFLLPAHQRYFPKDYTPSRCRKEISNAVTKSQSQRVQAYRTVCQNFHPVMRFFFMEHFLDPDDWFYKRLNYSRSTAAVSVLGHVLGLGDRHGHNILLDTSTGEAVHIDLGVAFEAGRVLPIPEVVPFRLTRDLVDGMGISGVEGVFRRCCNFTLEALRREQESIMTILDVLRYDPLYSWSVSPLRVARMQENANRAAEAGQETNVTGTSDGTVGGAGGRRKDIDESAEASRALNVVAKKLGKGMSVEATVNQLIRQATDERNLAVLFCGWAAYA